jgi:hypothetical protein
MKKVLFSLFFICLFLFPAFADYTVDSVSVGAQVATSGKTQVTTTLQLTFDSAASSVSIPLPDGDVSHVSAGDFRYKVQKTDAGTNVVLSAGSGFSGTQTFQISYMVAAASDKDDTQDSYSLGLLSSRWEKPIAQCSFQVTLPGGDVELPEDFQLEPEVLSGYYGSLSSQETAMEISGNLISGTVTDRMAYDSLTLEVSLPQGYFFVRSASLPVISITWLSMGMLLLLVLCMIYWRLKLRTPRQRVVPRQLPPEGTLSCQLPQILDGKTCDLSALILEWASLGYLTLNMHPSGKLILTRSIPMGSERSRAEQRLYASIFGKRRQVVATPGRFSRAAARFRAASRKSLNRVAFDRKGGNVVLVQLPCRLLLAIGVGYMSYALLPEGGGYIVLAVIFGLMGLMYSIYLHDALSRWAALKQKDLWTWFLILFGVGLLVLSLLGGALLETAVGLLACWFSAIATAPGPRRSQRGQDLMAQAKGCRMFYRQASWQKLQVLLGSNDRFFQDQLPRAVALGVDKRFARRFEQQKIPVPDWLTGVRGTASSAKSLHRQLVPILKCLRQSFR